MFKTVPITVSGPSYQLRSRPLSSQSTINFYQEYSTAAKATVSLQSWAGQVLFGSAPSGTDRGQHVMSNVTYRIVGSDLFRVDSLGNHVDKGFVGGTDRCTFADNGTDLFICNTDASGVYKYSNATDELTEVTDSNIVGSIAVTFLNGQFIYTKPNLFIVSDVGNGAVASGLNAGQAESQPDDLVRAYAFNQVLYMIGERTVEPWQNTGIGLPPFARIDAQIIQIGTAATNSINNNDNYLYWLGDDRQIYRTTGGSTERITSIAIAHAIEGYTTVDDALAWTITLEGQNFYVITFPTEGVTWALNESLGQDGWFQLSAGDDGGEYNAASYSYVMGNHYVGDKSTGDLYKLCISEYTNNGEPIKRVRTMGSISGELFQMNGKRLQMSRFELILETGVGTVTGQGDDPQIMIEASYDGGRSFTAGEFMNIGRLGETNARALWWNMTSFYDLIIRITTSDPVSYTIQSGAIDIRMVGR
jgi:hypothetical protein